MSRRAAWAAVLVLTSACTQGQALEVEADPSRVPAQQAPQRFGFGKPADPARVAAWDIDVRPDGAGLPAGSGTVAAGAAVYQQRCAACHGPDGTGGRNDILVSTEPWVDWPVKPAVGNYWPYATTLYDYIVRAMPQDRPGSLTANETYAVIAWILNRNQLIPADAVMNAKTLPAVKMPARDRFLPDDRKGGPEVR